MRKFKSGDKVVRRKEDRGFPWSKGNTILTVRHVEVSGERLWFRELEGAWVLPYFELTREEKFSDDEWE